MSIRSPICVVVGHVDHGKSSILDKVRGTAIVQKEAGAITQAIGASIIPIEIIKKISGELLKTLNQELTLPGMLFIDTPGHAAFTTLRKRGGNLADIAILVVDINEGFKPQTIEAMEILKSYKTPFIVAANKVDLISGWQTKDKQLIPNIKAQREDVQQKLDAKLYELVAKFYEHGFQAERFDRLEDVTKQLAIIPCSAKSGEGFPELLTILTSLAQKFLEKNLEFSETAKAKGTILEVKEEQGLGTTLDVILYDGTLKKNDTIVIGTFNEPITTKVRALLEPNPLQEIRDEKAKFKGVDQVTAAIGVKIAAPDLDGAISGMPVIACEQENIDEIKNQVSKEVEQILIETEKDGIIIKADTLGGLEALTNLLKEKEVKIKKASIGDISKRDMSEAESEFENDPLKSVILGFNIGLKDVEPNHKVKIITDPVIYKVIENYEKWLKESKNNLEKLKADALTPVCVMQFMPNHTFRQNNPAIVGMSIDKGKARTGMQLMKDDGKSITIIKSMKDKTDNKSEAKAPAQLAIGLDKVTVGRQINEGDTFYSFITEDEFRKYKELKDSLTEQEKEILKKIAEIMRNDNPVWGV